MMPMGGQRQPAGKGTRTIKPWVRPARLSAGPVRLSMGRRYPALFRWAKDRGRRVHIVQGRRPAGSDTPCPVSA